MKSSDDGPIFHATLPQCHDCIHYRIKLFPVKAIEPKDKLSTVLAHENIERIWCRKGRIRYKEDGREKDYGTKYGLTCKVDSDDDCPDFECDTAFDFLMEEGIL